MPEHDTPATLGDPSPSSGPATSASSAPSGWPPEGHAIELVETDPERLVALREGRVPFTERGVQEALSAALASGDLTVLDHDLEARPGDRPHLRRDADRRPRPRRCQRRRGGPGRDRVPSSRARSWSSAARCRSGRRQRLLRDGHVIDESRGSSRSPSSSPRDRRCADFATPTRVVIGSRRGRRIRSAEAVLVEVFGASADRSGWSPSRRPS